MTFPKSAAKERPGSHNQAQPVEGQEFWRNLNVPAHYGTDGQTFSSFGTSGHSQRACAKGGRGKQQLTKPKESIYEHDARQS